MLVVRGSNLGYYQSTLHRQGIRRGRRRGPGRYRSARHMSGTIGINAWYRWLLAIGGRARSAMCNILGGVRRTVLLFTMLYYDVASWYTKTRSSCSLNMIVSSATQSLRPCLDGSAQAALKGDDWPTIRHEGECALHSSLQHNITIFL